MSYSVVSYLYVSFNRLITSVGEERANFLLYITRNYMVSVLRGFHWVFHIIIIEGGIFVLIVVVLGQYLSFALITSTNSTYFMYTFHLGGHCILS